MRAINVIALLYSQLIIQLLTNIFYSSYRVSRPFDKFRRQGKYNRLIFFTLTTIHHKPHPQQHPFLLNLFRLLNLPAGKGAVNLGEVEKRSLITDDQYSLNYNKKEIELVKYGVIMKHCNYL